MHCVTRIETTAEHVKMRQNLAHWGSWDTVFITILEIAFTARMQCQNKPVVTQTDRFKLVRKCCIIESWYRSFCYRTESDILFLYKTVLTLRA